MREAGDVQARVLAHLRRRRALEDHVSAHWPDLPVGPSLDICEGAAVLRRLPIQAGPAHRHRWRPRAVRPRRLGDHRPHLPRRRHPDRQPRRSLPDRSRRRSLRLQQLRLAARQSRGHAARHVRQHPPPQRARPARGLLDAAHAGRHRDDHLRCGGALSLRARAAHCGRGQGVWVGLVTRLGRQGAAAAGRSGGDRRELRAHPSLEPGRHGRASPRVRARREPQDAGAHRS